MNGFFAAYRQLAWGIFALPFVGITCLMISAIACKVAQQLMQSFW